MPLLVILLLWPSLLQGQASDPPPQSHYLASHSPGSGRQLPQVLRLADFDEDPFGYEPTLGNVMKKLGNPLQVRKEAVKNLHNPALLDTIYHLAADAVRLDIYKGRSNEFLFAATIADRRIALRDDIHIGMTREEFCDKFHELRPMKHRQGQVSIADPETMTTYLLELSPAQITIANDAATVEYRFVFQQNRLRQINLAFYYD